MLDDVFGIAPYVPGMSIHLATPTAQAQDTFLTKEDVAKRLKIRPRTVNRYMAQGMPHYNFGGRRCRFKAHEVDAWIAEQFRIVRA